MNPSLTPNRAGVIHDLFEELAARAPQHREEALVARCGDDPSMKRLMTTLLAIDARAPRALEALGARVDVTGAASRWERLGVLLEEMQALGPAERPSLVFRLADGDADIVAELSDLLKHKEAVSEVLDLPSGVTPAGAVQDEPTEASAGTSEPLASASAPAGTDDALVGRVIGHYRVLGRLGQGGMGVVYKARDVKLDREVAIKFLPPALVTDADTKTRFLHEARAASALDHPNIATIHEVGETQGGQPYMVMAYYEGETLQALIERGPLPLDTAIDIALQVARGLERAHEEGIVHRDIKPANVILTLRGQAKIVDFGLAKVADVNLTRTGTMMGTVAYMSPEQIYGEAVDQRADLWALGLILYEMLTGEHPFQGPHEAAIMYATANRDPSSIASLRPEVPEPLAWIVERLLQKAPADRYGGAAAVVRDLDGLRGVASGAAMTRAGMTRASLPAGIAAPAPPAGGPGSGAIRMPEPAAETTPVPWWRRPVAAGALAVLLALTAGGVWLATQADAPNEPVVTNPEVRAEARRLVQEGLRHFTGGQYEVARASFVRATEADPTLAAAWTSLSAVNFRLGDYETAVENAEEAVRMDDASGNAHYNLGLALEELGRTDEAIEAYADAVARDQEATLAYSALGNLYVEEGRTEDALRVLDQARTATPESPYIFLIFKNLGKAEVARGNHEAAQAWLQQSLDLRADWPETLRLMAESHEQTGEIAESRTYWQRYLDVETNPELRAAVEARLEEL